MACEALSCVECESADALTIPEALEAIERMRRDHARAMDVVRAAQAWNRMDDIDDSVLRCEALEEAVRAYEGGGE
jgi:hypothetical protein